MDRSISEETRGPCSGRPRVPPQRPTDPLSQGVPAPAGHIVRDKLIIHLLLSVPHTHPALPTRSGRSLD
jgi:hypothetical protein